MELERPGVGVLPPAPKGFAVVFVIGHALQHMEFGALAALFSTVSRRFGGRPGFRMSGPVLALFGVQLVPYCTLWRRFRHLAADTHEPDDFVRVRGYGPIRWSVNGRSDPPRDP
jgi:hypothetical protein